ncbi:MAG TPA: pyridoxamine 5'-phosphate oxidase family protein [Actinomycetota bacterium]|nr:pyridoxamine 5'-phosphate oxidase family protein [Actinomycetota bacterium]
MTDADAATDPLTWDVVQRWLASSKYYWVVTSRPDGRPHTRAVWGVWLEPRFHFTTSPETVMARNVVGNGYALMHPESAVDVVIVEGTVHRAAGTSLASVADAYERKYGWRMDPEDPGMPFYSLEAQTALSWKARDPRGSAVRWRFDPA